MKVLISATLCAALTLAAGAEAAEPARYRIEVEVTWSARTHPHEFPAGAHFSGLVGATHDSRYVLFADGRTAGSGLELVAENGRGAILKAEFAEAARRKRVGTVFDSAGLGTVPGTMTATFEIDLDHPFLSFVTMIAPSPDWFTGASAVPLLVDGSWADRLELVLWAWDAGTDDGETYSAPDADTQPRQSVRLLATPHVLDGAGLKPVGSATLVRLEE